MTLDQEISLFICVSSLSLYQLKLLARIGGLTGKMSIVLGT